MDSLLATYASSDEEEDRQQPPHQNQSVSPSKPASKFGENSFSSLPPPKSQLSNPPPQTLIPSKPDSRLGSSLPPPKSSSASLFSSLPQPKTEKSDPFSLNPKPKKVVQFRPPVNTSLAELDDDEEEVDEVKEEKRRKDSYVTEAPSVKSFLSTIPAPRNSGSLGALPSSSGMGRRSILEGEVPALSNSNAGKDTANKASDQQAYNNSSVGNADSSDANSLSENYINHEYNYSGYENVGGDYVNYDNSGIGGYGYVGADGLSYGPSAPASDGYMNYGGYSDYGHNDQYESKWIDKSSGVSGAAEPEILEAVVERAARVPGKRGRTEIPHEIIEVKQDELMKNRPREDQVKSTGIAFGPSYQPASSAKGKPSKLHKRKHQIGTLYFDMRQKEMELAERRSKGFLTKAETQAKYGW